jgi:hypothetical protein
MTFYKLDEVPVSRDDRVFKESPTINAVAALILFGIAGFALYLGIIKWHPSAGTMSPAAPYYIAGIFALVGLFPVFNVRACLKQGNWLLRCQLSGLIIKYRAWENWKLPADSPQAVGLDYGEIAWAKLIKERRTAPASDPKYKTETTWLTFLALGLAKPNTSELEASLEAERNLRPNGRLVILDYPVQVQPGGVVEIRWGVGIRPSARKALQVIGQRVKILETEHRKTDLTHRAGANPEEEKTKIIALAKSGDHFGAVKLARQVYGYNLTQANEFVGKLVPDGLQKDD